MMKKDQNMYDLFARWIKTFTVQKDDDADLTKNKETVAVCTLRGASVLIESMSTCSKIFIVVTLGCYSSRTPWSSVSHE